MWYGGKKCSFKQTDLLQGLVDRCERVLQDVVLRVNKKEGEYVYRGRE